MKNLLQPFIDIVFPKTCVCCGSSLGDKDRYICVWCRKKRFEKSHVDGHQVLPENIDFVFTMWQFDKGGYLQDLLHNLKYNYLQDVGEELGYLTGKCFIDRFDTDHLQKLDGLNPIIIPVPLHKSKQRKRGYNQSRSLARGFSSATNWPVIDQNVVKRVKKTKTQTGLNSQQRSENLEGAFAITESEFTKGTFPIIIDDVFTTGATTFELARSIISDNQKAGIVTVAQS